MSPAAPFIVPQGHAAQVALDQAAKALMRADGSLGYVAAVKQAQRAQQQAEDKAQAQARAAAQAQHSAHTRPSPAAPAPQPAAAAGTAQPQATALDLWLSLKDVELHAGRAVGAGDSGLAREAAHLGATLRAALTHPGPAAGAGAPARAAALREASAWLARNQAAIAALRAQSLRAADATAQAAYRAHQQSLAGGTA
jgi:hypothetical protein